MLRLLHISDLHERGPREKEPHRRRQVLGDAWERNLDELLAEGAIDLVCITGDVADRGAPAEYEAATAFVDGLLSHLSLPRERLFVVPGNHDIDREVEKAAWFGLRDALARRADRLDVGRWMAGLGEAPLGIQAEWREAVLARQRAYRAWLRELGRDTLTGDGSLGYRVTLTLDGGREPVHVIGLDTAWLAGDDADAGRLLLTDTQFGRLATDDDGRPLSGLRLALMHHPFHDLADGQAARRQAADWVDVVLRGHLHQTALQTWQDPDRRFTEFAVGCLYEGHSADQYPNACQVLMLDRHAQDDALSGRNHFRAWSPGGGHWHDDDSLYRASRSGRLQWSLAARARAVARPHAPGANLFDPWNPAVPPRFVGRDDLLRSLDRALTEGRSVAVVGDWHIGKSSLLRTWELQARAAGRVVAWVNGEESTGRSPGAFVRGVTGLDAPEDSDDAAEVLARWAARVAPAGLPPLVLVDEVEAMFRAFEPRFFERLRGMMSRRAVVLAMSATEEIDIIYGRPGRTSPFHNLMETNRVGLLESSAAKELARRGAGVLTDADQAALHDWAGRHPFFLHLLGRYLVDARQDGVSTAAAIERFRDEAASRLRAVWGLLSEEDQQALRESVQTGLPISRTALQRRGLATEDGRPFGRVLVEWLKEGA
jgi:3',5'-cyclic AMP phosphodiesterase CpdA